MKKQFKVYSLIDKKFLENLHFIDNDGDLAFCDYGGKVIRYENQDNYKVLFSTGLKDKHGKLIFEGDIIKHQNYLYNVIWNYDCIGFKQIKITIEDFSNYTDGLECLKNNYGRIFERKELFNFDSCKIIGNIYENKNLLDNK